MKVIDARNTTWTAVVGAICWAFGATGVVLGELDYRGLTENPIPEPVGVGVTAIGTVLLLIALITMRRVHVHQGVTTGTPGYWITVAGLALMLFPTWPFIVIGPLVLGIGVTIYAGALLATQKIRSFGLWLLVLNLPIGIVVAFAFDAIGYDGGIGIALSLLLILGGFMSLAYDTATPEIEFVPSSGSERVEVVA
jgi:hypothetical protein